MSIFCIINANLAHPRCKRGREGGSIDLRQNLVYGDDPNNGPSNPETTNHKGKPYKHYDEAGLLTLNEYDFKGNVLQKTREVIADSEILSVFGSGSVSSVNCYRVDWDNSPQLEGNYQTDIEYDALNRVTKMKYPEDTDLQRKELTPAYNRSGALESVVFDGTTYVDHIAYNARGQRLLIAFGNDIMTRYAYDNKTLRLARIRSEFYSKTGWVYSPVSGLKQDTAYAYDLAGNIISTNDQSPNSGVGGTGSLARTFDYDPLYRLLSATGRENAPTITPIWDDRYRSDDHTLTTAYTQKYNYDKMGNILRLKHTGNSDFTRIFNPDSGNMPADYGNLNLLNEMKIGGTTYSFQYDANGNLTQENADRFYEWDAADQMRCFFINDGSTITKHAHYLYDAAGNRVKKLVRVDGGNYTSNTYIDGVFERKTDGTDEQNTLHIMDDASRIALVRLGDAMGDNTPPIKYILENHLGSSVMELKDDGQNISKEEYYPFGETSFGSRAFKRYKYIGKERDTESGLYYYGARHYAPWTCRFTSVDPLADQYAHLSSYNYASNSPIGEMDVDGMQNPSEGGSEQSGNGGSGTKLPVENGLPTVHLDTVEITAVAPNTSNNKATNDLSNEYKSAIQNSFSFEFHEKFENLVVRSNDTHTGAISADPNNNLFHEFQYNVGPVESVFLDDHPLTEALKNVNEVERLRYLVYQKYDGAVPEGGAYTDFQSEFGLTGILEAGINVTYQFVGTFSGDVFVSNDAKNLIFVLSDSKGRESLFYRMGTNVERNESGVYGTTYQKYIWSEPIDPSFFNQEKHQRDQAGHRMVVLTPIVWTGFM